MPVLTTSLQLKNWHFSRSSNSVRCLHRFAHTCGCVGLGDWDIYWHISSIFCKRRLAAFPLGTHHTNLSLAHASSILQPSGSTIQPGIGHNIRKLFISTTWQMLFRRKVQSIKPLVCIVMSPIVLQKCPSGFELTDTWCAPNRSVNWHNYIYTSPQSTLANRTLPELRLHMREPPCDKCSLVPRTGSLWREYTLWAQVELIIFDECSNLAGNTNTKPIRRKGFFLSAKK